MQLFEDRGYVFGESFGKGNVLGGKRSLEVFEIQSPEALLRSTQSNRDKLSKLDRGLSINDAESI
jgi:hypothetical protein